MATKEERIERSALRLTYLKLQLTLDSYLVKMVDTESSRCECTPLSIYRPFDALSGDTGLP